MKQDQGNFFSFILSFMLVYTFYPLRQEEQLAEHSEIKDWFGDSYLMKSAYIQEVADNVIDSMVYVCAF